MVSARDGGVLAEQQARGQASPGREVAEQFWGEACRRGGVAQAPSILALPRCYCFCVIRDEVCFLAAVEQETPPLLVLEFLGRLADLICDYFTRPMTEANIRSNLTTVFLLLEEMVDCGMPFTVEPNILKEMIPPPNAVSRVVNSLTGNSKVKEHLPKAAQSGIPWRSGDSFQYGREEFYVDFVEELDATVDAEGFVKDLSICGSLSGTCKMNGMPDVVVAFNHPHLIEDTRFHKCVRYARWAADRVVSFVPPDGAFKLMDYNVRGGGAPPALPIYVKPQISYKDDAGRVSVMVGTKQDFPRKAEGIAVRIPLAKDAVQADVAANHGTVHTDLFRNQIIWSIGRVPLDKAPCLTGKVQLDPSTAARRAVEAPTLTVSFTVPGMTMSGLAIQTLDFLNTPKQVARQVRYAIRGGLVEVRA